jgi:hypothetical protein
MNKDEALKMAIEALQAAEDIIEGKTGQGGYFAKPIHACKEALEQKPTSIYETAIKISEDYKFEWKEPAQEPVVLNGLQYQSVVEVMPLENGDDGNCDVINAYLPQGTKLYLHPAQLKRLSESEIEQVRLDVGFCAYGEHTGIYTIPKDVFESRLQRFADAIEQGLKEKNSG